MKIKLVLVLFLIVTATLLFFTDRTNPQGSSPSELKSDTPLDENMFTADFWSEVVRDKGAREAVAYADDALAQREVFHRHTIGHLLGQALYRDLGPEAAFECDILFNGGCIHQVFTEMMWERGALDFELLALCKTQYPDLYESRLGCIHAFGHGVMSIAEHNQAGLSEALATCDKYNEEAAIDSADERSWCWRGVFMDYNFQVAQADNLDTGRTLNEQNVYSPCDSIDDKYRSICYISQTRLWESNLVDLPLKQRYEAIAARCENIENIVHSEYCALGVGSLLVHREREEINSPAAICEESFTETYTRVACVNGYNESSTDNF